MSATDNLKKLEARMASHAKTNPGSDRIEPGFKASELRAMGLQLFNRKFTHQIRIGDGFKTFEIIPRK